MPDASSVLVPAHIIDLIQDFIVSRYVTAAAFTILLYDHLLTLPDEIRFIWSAKWSTAKALFLFNRYTIPCLYVIHIYDLSGFSGRQSTDTFCKAYLFTSLYIGMASIGVSNFLVLLRLWVIWGRNIALVVWTIALFVLAQSAALVLTTLVTMTEIRAVTVLHFMGVCQLSYKSKIVVGLWLPGIVFEVMVFVTVWLSALRRPRVTDSDMMRQLYRDGAIYFFTLTALRVTNLVLTLITTAPLVLMGTFCIWASTNVALSHLVLNFRDAGESDDTVPTQALQRATTAEQLHLARTRTYDSMELKNVEKITVKEAYR